ncbi:MAG TPA: DUF222 domain-containing protein [Streptosporangiaceae bacterium]
MCQPGQPGQPGSVADATASVSAALGWLASADATELTTGEQADCLRALERVQAQLVAARSVVLAAFTSARGFEDDAAASPVSWLRWQTRVTGAAASAAAGWMRDLAAHPAIAAALAAGDLSVSWARQVAGWTDRLPEAARGDADQILLAAAAGGARLSDLAGLAEQLHRLTAQPDTDGDDDGFARRRVRLLTHFRGAGTLDGDLTPGCAAALRAVLDALSARTGPEDTRTPGQRRHDALAEACRRLIAGGLPDRAGQPTQIHLHMTLDQLLGLPGAAGAAAVWAGHGATAPPGSDCDASITPIVTGHLDPAELDTQARDLLAGRLPADALPAGGLPADGTGTAGPDTSADPGGGTDTAGTGTSSPDATPGSSADASTSAVPSGGCPVCGDPGHGRPDRSCHLRPRTAAMAHTAARELLLTRAVRLLSGPAGLAAHLRRGLLPQPAASISLPLDLGKPTQTIPASLRRAIITRDKHCAFPGCHQPPAACQVHHLIFRSRGGPTSLHNCCLLCVFHHEIAIHRWGWQLRLNPDGTTTATLGDRTLHSHAPEAA